MQPLSTLKQAYRDNTWLTRYTLFLFVFQFVFQPSMCKPNDRQATALPTTSSMADPTTSNEDDEAVDAAGEDIGVYSPADALCIEVPRACVTLPRANVHMLHASTRHPTRISSP